MQDGKNWYAYANANPIRYSDPTGLYGKDTHYNITLTRAYHVGLTTCQGLACAFIYQIADLIAKGNQQVDEGILMANPFGGHPELHFQNISTAERNAEAAQVTSDPYLMGAALHQIQDWYSHWDEGYRWPGSIGHGVDSIAAGCLGVGDCHRRWQLIANFYIFHPFAKFNLSQMYPSINLNDISSDKLIDLYLYTFTEPGDMQRGPLGYGYDTDYYFGFTPKDLGMASATGDWAGGFFFELDTCEVQNIISGYDPPTPEQILKFLQTGVR
jgi:hypothetical protein